MAEEQIRVSQVMDLVIKSEWVQDWVIGSGLAQASVKINDQWFEVQIQPRTRDEIVASFGQAD